MLGELLGAELAEGLVRLVVALRDLLEQLALILLSLNLEVCEAGL